MDATSGEDGERQTQIAHNDGAILLQGLRGQKEHNDSAHRDPLRESL